MPEFTRVNSIAALVIALFCMVLPAEGADSQIDRALDHPDFIWTSIATDNVRLYYQPGSFAERHRVMLLRSARGALATGLEFLDQETDDRELRVLYVDDRAQMEELIGHTYSGFADWTGHGVFLVCNPDWRSFDTHEIAHILTMGRWGSPVDQSAWMIEGLPVAVDGRCATAGIDRIAAYLASEGRWPGLLEFQADPGALGEVAGGCMGASLIRFLQREYGPGILREIWSFGLVKTFEERNVEVAEVEQEWQEWLRDLEDPLIENEWDKIEADGCG